MQRRDLLMLAAAGSSLGYGAAVVQRSFELIGGPPGWGHQAPSVPRQLANLSGPPLALSDGYPMHSHAGLLGPPGGDGLEAAVVLPEGGVIELRLEQAVALRLSNVGDGGAVVLYGGDSAVAGATRRAIPCDNDLVTKLFAGSGTVEVTASLAADGDTVVAKVASATARCHTRLTSATPSLHAGLRRVGVRSARQTAADFEAPGAGWPLRLGAAAVGATLFGAAGHWAARAGVGALLGLVSLPLLLVGPLAHVDMERFLDAARMTFPAAAGWGLYGPVLGSLGLLSLALAWRLSRPGIVRGAGVVTAFAVLGAVLVLALGPRDPTAAAFAAGAGGCAGLMVWANATRARAFNLLSLGAVALGVFLAEHGLSRTQYGASLLGLSSRQRGGDAGMVGTVFDTFEALETTRAFRDYPDRDYPLRPPPDTGTPRIVAVGSSSTGGAYQNDNIDEFWPADLQRELGPGVQVVNQAVGGWTSLHVRRYLETQVDLVAPDVVVAYLGHNDILTPSPRPYAQLLAAWRSGLDPSIATSNVLGRLRVYQSLRFFVQALASDPGNVAVPVSDARENYQTLADVMAARGGKLLLVTEALSPDPAPLAAYSAMLAELASQGHVAHLDANRALLDPQVSGVFLDDCHLTRDGHLLLAEAVAASLRAEGWVP